MFYYYYYCCYYYYLRTTELNSSSNTNTNTNTNNNTPSYSSIEIGLINAGDDRDILLTLSEIAFWCRM